MKMQMFSRRWEPVIYRDANDGSSGGAAGDKDDSVDIADLLKKQNEGADDSDGEGDSKDGDGSGDGEGGDAGGDGSDDKPSKDGAADGDGDGSDDNKDNPPADEEIELKGIGKVKLSEVVNALKNSKKQGDLTQEFQKLAEEKKSLEELKKFGEVLKTNPKAFKKFLKALADDSDAGDNAEPADKGAQSEELKKILGDLDTENDPYAKALKTLFEHITGLSKQFTTAKQESEKLSTEEKITKARETMNTALAESAKELKIDDKSEEGKATYELWKQMTLGFIQSNHKDFESQEAFAKTIKEVGKIIKEKLDKIGEAKVDAYIKSKGGPAAPRTSGGGGQQKKEESVEYDPDKGNLMETLTAEIGKAMKAKEE